jgi:hypothetical protein
MVKLVHAAAATVAHTVPRFEQDERVVVIALTGPHHRELLHEICDALFDLQLDVLHAEVS